IKEAEGEAEAILKIEQAKAEAIRLINDASPKEGYLTLKSLEAFETASNGQATKIIITSEIQGIAGLAQGIKESLK
ncbi:MAG: peptidase, partial [Clostridia bacterium]|nr:peptidase [Clostridia bacterium]